MDSRKPDTDRDPVNLTKRTVEAIKPPATGRADHRDTKVANLVLTVTAKGAKTFTLYRRVQGVPKRIRIGAYPGMTPEQARDAARKLNARIDLGEDPQAEKRAKRNALTKTPTFKLLWETYRDKHLKPHRSEKTVSGDTYMFAALGNWQSRRISSMTPADVIALHGKLTSDRGPTMANRTVQFVRRLVNYAIDELGYTGTNPVKISKAKGGARGKRTGAVQLHREQSRDRFLHPDEAPRLFAALHHEETDPDVRDLVYLLLLTGARRRNMQAMAWRDINLDRALWIIPKSKNGDPVTVPLSRWALAILHRRDTERNGSPWVFPAPSRSGHIEETNNAWDDIRERAGLTDLTLHDLRRTMATWQRMAGQPLENIGASLGHRLGGVTGIYARTTPDTVRESIEAGTLKLLTAGGIEKTPETTDSIEASAIAERLADLPAAKRAAIMALLAEETSDGKGT